MLNTTTIVLIISIAACVAAIIVMYILGKKNQAKRDEQQAQIDATAQWMNIFVIDKKKMKLKESGLPQQVIDGTPWYARRSKLGVVKAKIGPKVTLLIAENEIFDLVPKGKEVKARMSGILITEIKGIRGAITKPEKKKNFFQKLMGEK